MTAEYFYLVPQKSGDVAVVRIEEPRTERTVRRIFAMAGGRAITGVAEAP